MDLQSRSMGVEYSKAKDEMFSYTDIKQAPRYVVNEDNKLCARLNCIRHLLGLIHYEDLTPEPMSPPMTDQTFVPEVYKPITQSADH